MTSSLPSSLTNPVGKKITHKEHGAVMAVIIALGIVYGDIGTSPLYVMRAIIADKVISELLIYGALSCVFWTLTLQTTLKYIIIVLRVDRKGQGGLLALYSLIKGKRWWLVFFAMAGASMLISEGLITPAISVSSAVEGLKVIYPEINTLPIVVTILLFLFSVQRFGTNIIGGLFGMLMLVWFTMLGVFGLASAMENPQIIQALNPVYAIELLTLYPGGFWLLGAIFLCTTGAEALYSDLGHCSRKSIRLGWIFVKICLLLNYFGQGAWLLNHAGTVVDRSINPFYSIIGDGWFLLPSIIISTLATIIASQALISGSYSLINEATRLNIWPKFLTKYPTSQKGQIYIPAINTFLCVGCIAVTYYFKESANMEAAYGLAVVTTMMNTTILFTAYLLYLKVSKWIIYPFCFFYLTIEVNFLVANLAKFIHGGWIIFLTGGFLFFVMWIWYQAKVFKRRHTRFTDFYEALPLLIDLSNDITIPKTASHLVFMTSSTTADEVETKIIYSLLERQPKRADMYWFVHVEIVDEPYICDYKVNILAPQDAVRIDFRLGFKVEPKINVFFKDVLEKLVKNNEINVINHYDYKKKQNPLGDISFVILKKFIANKSFLPFYQRFIINSYYGINRFALSEDRAFGIDDEPNAIIVEQIPISFKSSPAKLKLNRVYE